MAVYLLCRKDSTRRRPELSPQRTPLGRLLQVRREAKGYSRTRLGETLGIPPGTIEGWELGRVAKPPVHDVLKVARFLGIGADEIEAAVLEEAGPERSEGDVDDGGVVPLLEQAIELFGWTNDQAASALRVTPTRVRDWRTGAVAMTLPELMAVAALIGLHAAGAAEPLDQPSGSSSPRSRAR